MNTTGTDRFSPWRLSGLERWLAAVLGLMLLVPLGVAWRLEPDPRGHGTHEQLGFPPCGVRVAFGLPCPTCGMTTAWAHLAHGQMAMAVRASVGGTLLALLDLAAAPWLIAAAIGGRWRILHPRGRTAVVVAAAVVLITLIEWAVRLAVLTA